MQYTVDIQNKLKSLYLNQAKNFVENKMWRVVAWHGKFHQLLQEFLFGDIHVEAPVTVLNARFQNLHNIVTSRA